MSGFGLFLAVLSSLGRLLLGADDVPTRRPVTAVLVWREGEVGTRLAGTQGGENGVTVAIGDAIGDAHHIECLGPCRLLVLVGGAEIHEFEGPGRWSALGGKRLEGLLHGYQESAQVSIEAAMCLAAPAAQSNSTFIAPGSPVLLAPPSRFEWHESHGARYELTLDKVTPDGLTIATLEHWLNLRHGVHSPFLALERGAHYRLGVSASGPEGNLSFSSVFEVLDQAESATISEVERTLGQLGDERGAPRELFMVLRARFLERYGLWSEARTLWQALAQTHPELPELAKQASRLSLQWSALP